MPGPFPGMDPYLEDPAVWTRVHSRLIARMADALNPLLSPRYVADFGERLYVVQSEREILPDVTVTRPAAAAGPRGGGATALAEAAVGDPPWVIEAAESEMRETFIEIVSLEGETRVVTVIEILSPTNKAPGEGRSLYLRKQAEILASRIHLIEVDLLRQGPHTLAAPRSLMVQRGPWRYAVSLHRSGQGSRFEVWPVRLSDRLPRVRVPLLPGDPDAVLDLQAVMDRCYDEAAWNRRIDYRPEPFTPLAPEDAEWAARLLHEKGLR